MESLSNVGYCVNAISWLLLKSRGGNPFFPLLAVQLQCEKTLGLGGRHIIIMSRQYLSDIYLTCSHPVVGAKAMLVMHCRISVALYSSLVC